MSTLYDVREALGFNKFYPLSLLAADARRILKNRDEAVAALKEAVEFQNEDTECFAAARKDNHGEYCPDRRCSAHGCMVARINRWRAVIRKVEANLP